MGIKEMKLVIDSLLKNYTEQELVNRNLCKACEVNVCEGDFCETCEKEIISYNPTRDAIIEELKEVKDSICWYDSPYSIQEIIEKRIKYHEQKR